MGVCYFPSDKMIISDTIAYGESYDLSVVVEGLDPDVFALDDTYLVKYRFTDSRVPGTEFAAGTMTIADGAATATIDTGDDPWTPGIYYYDIRITDPDGHEYVSQVIELVITATQTQPA